MRCDFLKMVSGSHVDGISLGVQAYSDELPSWLDRSTGVSILDRAESLFDDF